jgi:8-oxo-dGTP pyrophosphatase MutT (NUDIX family)
VTETVVRAGGGIVWRRGEGGVVEIVLVHRPVYDDWSFPKGKLHPGETEAQAALREVQEETGLRCRLGIVAEFVPPVEVAPGFDIELDGGERARDVHFAKPQPMRARP